jgi:hypothetical protein
VTQASTHQMFQGHYYYAWARALWLQDRLPELKQVYGHIKSQLSQSQYDEMPETVLPRAVIGSLIDRSEGRYVAAEKYVFSHGRCRSHTRIKAALVYRCDALL